MVHAAYSFTPDGAALDQAFAETVVAALAGSGKPFLYTSGAGVYGETGTDIVDESIAPQPERCPYPAIAAWMRQRIATEQTVLAAANRNIRAIVLRPGLVYGRGAGPLAGLRDAVAAQRAAFTLGDGENAWSMLHIDDLADLYLLTLNKAPFGALYNAAVIAPVLMRNVSEALARGLKIDTPIASIPVDEAIKFLGVAAIMGAANIRLAPGKPQRDLRWTPTRPSVLWEMEFGSYSSND